MSGTIIYYGGFHLPDKNAAANRVVSNGKLFEKIGFNTIFLGADYECKSKELHKISDNMFEENHPETSAQWLKNILLFENLKKLSAEYSDIKLIVLYNVPFITLFLAKLFFKKQGIQVAYDCTEWTKYTEGSILKKAFKYVDEFLISHFAHLVADRMIVISKMMERSYKKTKHILRLPPLVDVSEHIWHQCVNKSEEKFVFCFAGFPSGNKECLDKVIDSFFELNKTDAIMNIVGLTKEDFCQIYPHMQEKISIISNVNFLGKCTHEETISNILNCDCYIFIRLPDKRNNAGFPTKFAESYTCGVPIITTDVSDVSSYAEADGVIVLDSVQVSDIVTGMHRIIMQGKRTAESKIKTEFDYNEYTDEARRWFVD